MCAVGSRGHLPGASSYTKGTILHELLAAYLQKAGLSMKDVKFVSMGLPAAASALENGSAER